MIIQRVLEINSIICVPNIGRLKGVSWRTLLIIKSRIDKGQVMRNKKNKRI